MNFATVSDAYNDTYLHWQHGYEFWRYVFYFMGALAVALPVFVAAGLPTQENLKRLMSAAAAAIVAIFTWLQPGTRATAHEHAYVCLEMALNGAKLGAYKSAEDFKAEADRCSRFIDYEYWDQPDKAAQQK